MKFQRIKRGFFIDLEGDRTLQNLRTNAVIIN